MKTRIYATPAVKGLKPLLSVSLSSTMLAQHLLVQRLVLAANIYKQRVYCRTLNSLTAGAAYIRVFIFY